MKTASFENTVDILVKAYLNDTLVHKNCGCAVHNIIEHHNGDSYPFWADVFITYQEYPSMQLDRRFYLKNYIGDAKSQIDSTGYTPQELSQIEFAFEEYRAQRDIFGCLMNVVDQLAIIHNVDLSVKESAKQLFVKA